jgi:hypothetical protein
MRFSFNASPMVRTFEGGTCVPMATAPPFGRKPGWVLSIM